jgi:hypothetical protein
MQVGHCLRILLLELLMCKVEIGQEIKPGVGNKPPLPEAACPNKINYLTVI